MILQTVERTCSFHNPAVSPASISAQRVDIGIPGSHRIRLVGIRGCHGCLEVTVEVVVITRGKLIRHNLYPTLSSHLHTAHH